MSGFMNTNDAPSSKLATLYCTVGGRRYAMLNAKNFEAKANVSLADVKMTLYKCTEAFDRLVEEYKNTGMLPTFEAEVESNDPATSMGASGKTYHQCMIEGDVLLSSFDADGDFIEQDIEAYAMDYSKDSEYKEPAYM